MSFKTKTPSQKKAAAKRKLANSKANVGNARTGLRKARKEDRASKRKTRKEERTSKRTTRAKGRAKRISASIKRQENKQKDPRTGTVGQANKKARLQRLKSRLKRNTPKKTKGV